MVFRLISRKSTIDKKENQKKENTFKQDVIKIILDKLLIAVIVTIVGFYFDKILTKYKEEQSFIFELNKKKVEKITQTWENLYEMEAKLNQYTTEFNRVFMEDSIAAKLFWTGSKQKDEIDSLGASLESTLYKNRVWFNNSDFENMIEYFNLLTEVSAVQNQNILRIKEISLRAKRETILRIRNRVLGE
jgi:hypothetical protein